MSNVAQKAIVSQESNLLQSVVTDSTALLQVISRAATDPAVDMDKMERLLAMHERLVMRDAEQAFNIAMAEAQTKMRRVSVDAENPQTRSKYASYAALDRALRPIYTDAGFSLSFDTGDGAPQDWVRVVCHVSHKGGFTRKHHIDMPADGKGAKGGDVMTKTHATGSAMTYGMRYLLKLVFNVAIGTDDNDGNGPNKSLSESEKADFLAAIEALVDRQGAENLWKHIASSCRALGDTSSYNELKEKITKKSEAFTK